MNSPETFHILPSHIRSNQSDEERRQCLRSRHCVSRPTLYKAAKMLRNNNDSPEQGWRKRASPRGRKVKSRLHDAVIRVYDEAGNVIETHEHKGDFNEP
jgi:hypothetical protein